MKMTEFEQLAYSSTSRFRLEQLPAYDVEHEVDEFAAWRAGDRTIPSPETDPFLATIRDDSARGIRWSRIRIVDRPLSEYTEFELHGLQGHAAAGEQVLIVDRAWHRDLDTARTDFWLFDDTLIRMVYTDGGQFVRPERVTDTETETLLAQRDLAARYAIPLADFLTIPDRMTA